VALGANHILVSSGSQVVVSECAVNVMTVAAFDQSFVHSMVEWHIECWFHIGMALKAKRRLSSFQQLLLVRAGVYAVAACAANATPAMRRTQEVGMRSGVATQARSVYIFG
jgi:hypothetical protein